MSLGGALWTRRRWRFALAIAVLTVAGVAPGGASGTSVDELAERFFKNARFSEPEISPDGKRIAVVYSEAGKEMIVVRSLAGGQAVPIVGLPDPEARLRWLRWVSDERLLFGVEEPYDLGAPPPRPRRTRLYAIDANGSNHVHLGQNWGTFILGRRRSSFQHEDDIIDFLEDDPNHVLISIRNPTESYPDVYRLSVSNGGVERVLPMEDGISTWYADHEGRVRAGFGYHHEKYRLVARPDVTGDFEELGEYESGGDWLGFEGFSFDSEIIYVSKANDDGVSALYEYDLSAMSAGREIFARPGFDVPSWLEFSKERRVLTAIGYRAQGPERHFVDEIAEKQQKALDAVLPKTFNRIVSKTADESAAIVLASSDSRPPRYYLFDVPNKKLSFLFWRFPDLAHVQFADEKPVAYTARDGMSIPGYLTLPRVRSSEKLPLIVYPHGGPTSRDVLGFERAVQFFAALGFAVFQPNFRGSSGYGDEHRRSGYRQWGLSMQDDITDGVKWLVKTGVADPARVCIYGASYGGYAALMGLVKTPELFRCAAAYAAPTDLVMLLNHQRGYVFADSNRPLLGSTSKDKARLVATSPLKNIDKIRVPVFLAHGEDDDRVHVAHSQKLAKALQKAGKPVELIVIEDEAHSFRDESKRIELFQRLGAFVLENTIPKAEPGGG
ncbi:MAG: prolyl oligopeptidase family serine peptidase [Thermoanaerobaculia bacterium]